MRHSELLIRPFEEHDQECARLLILSGLGEHFGYIDGSLNPDIDDIMKNYVKAGHVFLVVQSGNDIVGTGGLIIEDDGIGRLVRISVHHEHRRNGIGKAVVERLVEVGRQRGLQQIQVETNNDWYDAIALYKHLGFLEYEQDSTSIHMLRNL